MVLSLQLLGTLIGILVAAEIFTNALEHLGERIGISAVSYTHLRAHET